MAKEEGEKELKPEWKIFAHEYVIDWNGTRAYKVAYPNATDKTAAANSYKLLRNTEISDYIEEIQKDLGKLAGLSALGNLNHLTDILTAETKTEVDGKEVGIKSESTKDRINALKVVNEMLGYNAPVKKDIRLETDRKDTSDLFPSDDEFDEQENK